MIIRFNNYDMSSIPRYSIDKLPDYQVDIQTT